MYMHQGREDDPGTSFNVGQKERRLFGGEGEVVII